MRIPLFIVGLGLAIAMPILAIAHGVGFSFEKQSGQYLVDIGYDVTQFVEGEDAMLTFLLVRDPGSLNWEYETFSEVRVEVMRGGTMVMQKTVTDPEIGPAFLVYAFPKQGTYQLGVRYLRDGQQLAEAYFPVPVLSAGGPNWGMILGALFLGVPAITLFIFFVILPLRRRFP